MSESSPRDGGGNGREARVPIPFDTAVDALPAPAWLHAAASELGIEFEDGPDGGDVEKLGKFLALLLRANELMNLTAITEPEAAWRKHVLDSLTLVPLLSELSAGASVADVGSGGGLPGIPLAISLPNLRFTLIEATAKKCRFLEAAVGALRLTNTVVVNGRAEEVGHRKGLRESFDAVCARAVGKLESLIELTVPLVKPGGCVYFIKGARAEEELAGAAGAIEKLHCAHAGTVPTPTGRIVVLEKLRATPATYPRRSGEPGRKPLK